MRVAATLLALLPALAALAIAEDCGGGVCEARTEGEVEQLETAEADALRLQLLQLSRSVEGARRAEELVQADGEVQTVHEKDPTETKPTRDLAFVHLPCNFGHTVEGSAMGEGTNWDLVKASFHSTSMVQQWKLMHESLGRGGALWGEMNPAIRGVDVATGCSRYYMPGKMWPKDLAKKYFNNRTIFGILRDPYDRAVNDFRQMVFGLESIYPNIWRWNVSVRQHKLEREGPEYQQWYKTCDVNAYLKSELGKYLAGDRYRVGCHLLPQAEFFDQPYGITLPIDNRKLPDSFNKVMEEHGYPFRMGETLHNTMCNNVSAYSLDAEAKALVKKVYARDFELVCKYFGYCDSDEMTCLEQIPQMCGGKPNATAV